MVHQDRPVKLAPYLITVLIIVALGYFFWNYSFAGQYEKMKNEQAQVQVREIVWNLEKFFRECGYYPSEAEGLKALVDRTKLLKDCPEWNPSMKRIARDPWNADLQYKIVGDKFVVMSWGQDGLEKTPDDISSDLLRD